MEQTDNRPITQPVEGYCLKCKAKRIIKNPQRITTKNNRPASRGSCHQCSTEIFRIGKVD